jgi:hypothetical protein
MGRAWAYVRVLAFVAVASCAGRTNGAIVPFSAASHQSVAAALACDGRTDVTAALQAAIDATAKAGGGIVSLPHGVCIVSRTIEVARSNVTLRGIGAGDPGADPKKSGTALLWKGAAGGTLLRFGAARAVVSGSGIDGISLFSNYGRAAYGLRLNGAAWGVFSNFSADAFSVAAVALDRTPFDQMHNRFENFNLDNQLNAGAGLVVGTATLNTAYYNEFDNALVQIKDGIGIEQLQSDGNVFVDVHEFLSPHGKGIGVLFGCGSTSNHFFWLSAAYSNSAKGVVVLGIKACTWPKEAWADSIDLYDQNDNGGPPPVVGRGTDFTCRNDLGKPCGQSRGP